MQLTKTLKLIATPLVWGVVAFVFTFVVFTTAYSFFEYRSYLSSYQATQRAELNSIQQKTDTTFKKLDELLLLTSSRIAASQGNAQRIQNILVSAPRLYTPLELPNIQSLVYYMLSKPFSTISRFGVFPQHSQPSVPQSPIKDAIIVFQDGAIISKIPVFDENETLKGILEIKLIPSDFRAFLGEMKTLSFIPSSSAQDRGSQILQKTPFVIYAKPPDSFWEFVIDNNNYYAIFFFYTIIIFLLFVLCIFYLNLYFHRKYENKIATMEINLAKVTETGEQAQEKLITYEQKYKSCWTSFQSYKKIYANLNNEKREQALQICKALEIVVQGCKGAKLLYSTAQQYELIGSSLKCARFLSEGTMIQKRQEKISFNSLFEAVSALFSEKMYKSKAILETTCPDDLFFYGDPLFMELILLNLVGKAIYRFSKNGKILITATDQEKTIFFELRDKGFPLDDKSEKAFKQAFDLFIPEIILKKMCHENDLQYILLRDKQGFNITQIIIPKFPAENLGSNIVRLFL